MIEKSKKKLSGAQVFKTDETTHSPVKIRMTRVTDDKDSADASVRGQNGDEPVPSLLGGPGSPKVPMPDMHVVQKAVAAEDVIPPVPAETPPDFDDSFNPFLKTDPTDQWTSDIVIRGQNSQDPFLPGNPLFDPSPQGDPYSQVHRTPTGEIDLDYYLTEDRTGRLMFGVGVNSSSGLVGSVVLQEQNFDILRPPTSWDDIMNGTAWRGAGQRFRIELVPGTEVSRYTVSWQDSVFHEHQQQPRRERLLFPAVLPRLGRRPRGRAHQRRATAQSAMVGHVGAPPGRGPNFRRLRADPANPAGGGRR